MPPIIQTWSLTKTYGTLTAVESISLSIAKGEVFGVLGPNGAGKTTLLSMLCTMVRPAAGTAIINGHDLLKDHAMVRRSIGIVFQDPSIDADMTAYENLQMHADLYGVVPGDQKTRISEVLRLVQLEERSDDFVSTFSGGMRRRLEIARGLLHYPRILFLDEPTIGLDPQSREHIWDYIRNLRAREEMTIILTTHYMEEADRLCDRVAIIDHGRIVALDRPEVLKNQVGGNMIRLGTEDTARLSAVISEYRLAETVRIIDREVRATVSDAHTALPRIMEVALNAGIQISSIHFSQPDMNDVFIHYTGRDLRADQGRENSGRMGMMKRRRSR